MNRSISNVNTSGVKGVHWHKLTCKWAAVIKVRGKRFHLGLFTDMASAKAVYDAKAKELFGEFRRTA